MNYDSYSLKSSKELRSDESESKKSSITNRKLCFGPCFVPNLILLIEFISVLIKIIKDGHVGEKYKKRK